MANDWIANQSRGIDKKRDDQPGLGEDSLEE